MKTILLIYCSFFSGICIGQDTVHIIGKWKVISMKNQRMFLDLRADTIYLTKTLEERLISDKQFEQKKAVTKKVLRQFFDSASYEFRKDLSYTEYAGINGTKSGTYSIHPTSGILRINVPKNNDPDGSAAIETMKYTLQGKRLVLADSEIDNGAIIELEKQ